MRVEGGDQHEGLVQQLVDPLRVGLDAHHAVVSEGDRRVAQQPGRVEHVLDLRRQPAQRVNHKGPGPANDWSWYSICTNHWLRYWFG